jgi:sec-independent protein translocase protein TatA
MLGNAFGWPHLIIILAVVLLLFGATRLPALSRSLGQSIKIFRREVKTELPEDAGEESEDEEPVARSTKSSGAASSTSKSSSTKASKTGSNGDSSSKK